MHACNSSVKLVSVTKLSIGSYNASVRPYESASLNKKPDLKIFQSALLLDVSLLCKCKKNMTVFK